MKIFVKSLVAPLLLCGMVMAQSTCNSSTSSCSTQELGDLKGIVQILKSSPGLSPKVYRLDETPSSRVPLRLFRNEVELDPASDYTVQGDFINIADQLQLAPTDVLRVEYAKDVDATADSAPASSGDNREALSRYLQRSLNQELSTQSNELAAEQLLSAGTSVKKPSSTSGSPVYRSLRMLTDALDGGSTARDSAKISAKEKRHTGSSVQGVDGTGDESTAGPFDILAATPGGLNESLSRIDSRSSADQGSRDTKSKTLKSIRSLEMLQSQLGKE